MCPYLCRHHGGHKYSLDDILDRNHAILQEQDHTIGYRAEAVPKPMATQGQRGGGREKPATSTAGAFGQDMKSRADSILAIAKGGWQPHVKRAPIKPTVLSAEGKHVAGHRFDFWRPAAAKQEMPWPGTRPRRRNVGVVSTEDSDAVLELHYAKHCGDTDIQKVQRTSHKFPVVIMIVATRCLFRRRPVASLFPCVESQRRIAFHGNRGGMKPGHHGRMFCHGTYFRVYSN